MDNSPGYGSSAKALPPLGKSDDLPPPPSPFQSQGHYPPPPPPKSGLSGSFAGDMSEDGRSGLPSPNDHQTASLANSSPGPSSPKSGPPSNLSQGDSSRSKKANPFVDLLETEKIYVDSLSGIIRKVAAAWSRSNLPPHELDTMFRSVEAVFKANRSFHSKLKEIGPNPSSPRAIGDLLMKWIDQLDTPYTNYCSSYLNGFDSWEPVQSNKRLPSILESFSLSIPPPNASIWTLDLLFSLPRSRIKYYQKLYGRLLKTSAPGKSTDKKLVEGVERLEKLLTIIDERSSVTLPNPTQVVESTDEVVIDTREDARKIENAISDQDKSLRVNDSSQINGEQGSRLSLESSAQESSRSSEQRSSRDTALTSEGNISSVGTPMSLFDLERRLSTDRCKDLFTMNPRSVRLSMNPPNLPYTREIRLNEDTSIHFTPKSTNIGVLHRKGHIFLLTDLFLICEHMSPEERAQCESPAVDMWLCYPPLAAKHLRAVPLDDVSIQVTILKKENMILHFDSKTKRDNILNEIKAVAELATALPAPSKQPPPPVPPLNNVTSPDLARTDRRPSLPGQSFSPPRSHSPVSGDPSMHRMDPARDFSSDLNPSGRSGPQGPPPYSPSNESFSGPGAATSPPGPRPGEPGSFIPGQVMAPPRGESTRMMGLPPRPGPNGPSFNPGQVIPGQMSRGDSVRTVNSMQHGMLPPQHTMSPPPMNGPPPPRHMMSPPPMNNLNGMPPMSGPGGPQRNGSVGSMGPPRPPMGGPGPFPPGPGSMRGPPQGPQGPMPMLNHPQPHQFQPNPPFANPGRPTSDPNFQGGIRKTPSLHSLHTAHQYDPYQQPPRSAPPVPHPNPQGFPPNFGPGGPGFGEGEANLRPMLPSAALPRIASGAPDFRADSPPPSPTERAPSGPVQSSVLASMKCKVFLQQQHAQWKSLGSSKLTLYEQRPAMVKQLVVEADNKEKTMLISTIVLTDGVERVGKTGIAIELSDAGARTGIVYMIQLRNEKSAGGLYETLLTGSDRGGFQ